MMTLTVTFRIGTDPEAAEKALADGESAIATLYQLDGFTYVRTFHEVVEDGPEADRAFAGTDHQET